MWRHTAWNYERALKGRLVSGIILRASKCEETKIHKTWSLCQPHADSPRQCYQHLKASGTSHYQFSSSETHTARSPKSWDSFAGRSLVLQGLVSCIALQLPSHRWSPSIAVRDVIRMKQSDWSATNGAWNKNWTAVDQTIFPLRVRKQSGHETTCSLQYTQVGLL